MTDTITEAVPRLLLYAFVVETAATSTFCNHFCTQSYAWKFLRFTLPTDVKIESFEFRPGKVTILGTVS